jgi:hypothetical protein
MSSPNAVSEAARNAAIEMLKGKFLYAAVALIGMVGSAFAVLTWLGSGIAHGDLLGAPDAAGRLQALHDRSLAAMIAAPICLLTAALAITAWIAESFGVGGPSRSREGFVGALLLSVGGGAFVFCLILWYVSHRS